MDEEDEEALMQRALAMSMLDVAQAGSGESSSAPATVLRTLFYLLCIDCTTSLSWMCQDDTEGDAELRMALQMSVANDEPTVSAPSSSSSGPAFEDPSFVNQLLGAADLSDPLVQAAIAQLNAGTEAQNSKDKNDAEKSKKRKGDDV